jgi:hypothetical protein
MRAFVSTAPVILSTVLSTTCFSLRENGHSLCHVDCDAVVIEKGARGLRTPRSGLLSSDGYKWSDSIYDSEEVALDRIFAMAPAGPLAHVLFSFANVVAMRNTLNRSTLSS